MATSQDQADEAARERKAQNADQQVVDGICRGTDVGRAFQSGTVVLRGKLQKEWVIIELYHQKSKSRSGPYVLLVDAVEFRAKQERILDASRSGSLNELDSSDTRITLEMAMLDANTEWTDGFESVFPGLFTDFFRRLCQEQEETRRQQQEQDREARAAEAEERKREKERTQRDKREAAAKQEAERLAAERQKLADERAALKKEAAKLEKENRKRAQWQEVDDQDDGDGDEDDTSSAAAQDRHRGRNGKTSRSRNKDQGNERRRPHRKSNNGQSDIDDSGSEEVEKARKSKAQREHKRKRGDDDDDAASDAKPAKRHKTAAQGSRRHRSAQSADTAAAKRHSRAAMNLLDHWSTNVSNFATLQHLSNMYMTQYEMLQREEDW